LIRFLRLHLAARVPSHPPCVLRSLLVSLPLF